MAHIIVSLGIATHFIFHITINEQFKSSGDLQTFETFSKLIRKHVLIAFAVMLETSYSRCELMT